jgi:hypothetical protein
MLDYQRSDQASVALDPSEKRSETAILSAHLAMSHSSLTVRNAPEFA